MADIFVSYTSTDKDWAFWIGQQLETLGHSPHVHDWEISAGGDIAAWMEERHHKADNVLLVVSDVYLTKGYSKWERLAAQWAAANERPNFALPVLVEDCKLPTLLAQFKRCNLYGIDQEEDARQRLREYLTPASRPGTPVAFPPKANAAKAALSAEAVPFPGGKRALSNIPVAVPLHFLGRDPELAAIDAVLKGARGRVAALHGLRGVGKTTLAAAYAERHRGNYRATWWIRAQAEATMRADLVALGVQLGWVATDEKEEPALDKVRHRMRHDGDGLLLVYDNAIDPAAAGSYLPIGGAADALVTSNTPAWGKVAEPIAIDVWSNEAGADFLIARTKRTVERADAEALSDALGGLPLAHEQAAAYCERVGTSFREYQSRFIAEPARVLDAERDAPAEYHNKLTVAKAFALAIEEAAKLHPAAEPLIVHAALLAPEPIPLFLFSEGRERFGEPLASQLTDYGLDDAVGALRAFALVDREMIPDERDPTITTGTIRLHRLVRKVAAGRVQGEAADAARRVLVDAMAAVYPTDVFRDPATWPRARRLDALGIQLVSDGAVPPRGGEMSASTLLGGLGSYRHGALAAFAEARPLFEHSLKIAEEAFGSWHLATATSLNNLALLLEDLGDLSGAGGLLERALEIWDKVLGREHAHIATGQNNLGLLFHSQGKILEARHLIEQALATREKMLGPEHLDTAVSIASLARLLQTQGDLSGAGSLYARALVILENKLGVDDVNANRTRSNLALLRLREGAASAALTLSQAALAAHDKVLGTDHPWTKHSARVTADALDALGRADEAAAVRTKYGLGEVPAARD
ncbi:MAG TPA: toll/interleukin-1 receptor domain-containing protein [Roseiarcus sp.]|nr:toll/interleukin-1 receptor domain-containing protein [Roseiarcus sp.]